MKRAIRNIALGFVMFMAICVVFGRTLMNLNCASITMVYPTRNYLKHSFEAEGEIVWGDPVPVTLYEAAEYPVIFSEVNMVTGQRIEAGTVLAKGTPDDKWKKALNELESEVKILRYEMWQQKAQSINSGARLTTEKSMEALDLLRLEEELFAKEKEIIRKAHEKGLSIPDNPQAWEDHFPTSHDAVTVLYQQWLALKDQIAERQKQLNKIYRTAKYIRDLSFIIDMEIYKEKISALELEIIQTLQMGQRLQRVTSQLDGYIAQVDIDEHQQYAALSPAYVLSSGPILTVDITPSSRIIVQEGASCQMHYQGKVYTGEIQRVLTEHEGGRLMKSALIRVDPFWDTQANPSDIIGKKVKIVFSETTDLYDCVVPMSAIAFTGSGPEVYMVERKEGYWDIDYRLKAVPVEILDYNDSFAAITGSLLGGNYLASQWDRPIENGSKVIPIT